MNRIDALISKATPKRSRWERLKDDNPFTKYSKDKLMDMMDAGHYTAPDMRTKEWNQFIYALVANCFGEEAACGTDQT